MWHLIKYRFLQITRNRPMMFWALAFPMILGTLFYISFGNIGISATGDSDWDPVPVAVINKLETKSSGTFFADFLDAMNGSDSWNLLRKRDPVSYNHKKWSQPKYSDFSFKHL